MKSKRAAAVLRGSILGALLFAPLVAAERSDADDSASAQRLVPLLGDVVAEERPAQPPAPARPNLGAADLERLLPIRSPGLTVGEVEPRQLDLRFARPIFLIGADTVSRRWLAAHRDTLLRLGAVGILVQADSIEDLRAIAELAAGLPIMPAPGSDIAQVLGLAHYPVLISGRGIEQ